MPSVVAGAVAGVLGVTGILGTVVTAVVGAGVSMAVGSLTIKPGARRSVALTEVDRSEMVRSAVAPRRVIYGRARVSGPLVFVYTTDSPVTGRKNDILHMVIPVAAHEVSAYGALLINDEYYIFGNGADGWKVPPATTRFTSGPQPYDGASTPNGIQYRPYFGTSTQAADKYLMRDVPVWTAQHRLQGVAYLYFKLGWNQSTWAGGLPNLSIIVEGRKLYDPRSGSTYWNNNPALCIRDYLLSSFGLSCRADEIDEDSFIAAANLCDEPVPNGSGGTRPRYSCNGVIELDGKPIDIMEQLLSSCAGTLVYTQGRYKLYPAAYRAPLLSLDESCLRGPVVIRPQPARSERVNSVRGTYIEANISWKVSEFAAVTNPAYVAQDGGIVYTQDLQLPFTIGAQQARQLAQLQLERSRRALTVEVPCTLAALDVAVMEPVRLSVSQLGWKDKVFLPLEWKLAPEGGVDLVLIEDDPSLYVWAGDGATVAVPPVVLPDISPDPPVIGLSEQGGQLIVSLALLNDAFTASTEIRYRRAGDEAWQNAGNGERVAISGLASGQVYEVEARVLNALGIASPWARVTRQLVGDAVPPGDISQLVSALVDGTLYLDWQAPQGSVTGYRLRWSPATTGALWSSAVDVAGLVQNTRASLPARLGAYLIKAVDAYGRESANAASYVNLTPDPRGANVVATRAEAPAFAGGKTNVSVNGAGQLIISSLSAFDALAGSFDALAGNFDSAGGGLSPEGVYEFAAAVDLGAAYVVRASASISAEVIDLVTDLDGAVGDFDSREGHFDGAAPSAVDVLVEVATTSGDPAGSPAWSAWQQVSVSDLVGRGFKFRARLVSANLMATPAVTALGVVLDMPDRVAAGSNLTSAPAGDSISFAPAFKETPAITITPANLASGDYFVITARSRSGFAVQFRNSAGTGIARSYDWVARGFGREQ